MLTINYPNLSCGYLGHPYQQAVINSQFYASLLSNHADLISIFNELVIFPQRTPRAGFFYELNLLETPEFRLSFSQQVAKIESETQRAIHSLNKHTNKHAARQVINWVNLLLRYGRFEAIIRLDDLKTYTGPFHLEISLLIESARVEILLSNDQPILLASLIKLANTLESDQAITTREKILLLNKLIVYHCRYSQNKDSELDLMLYKNQLESLLESLEASSFIKDLYRSVSYRGIAMIASLDHTEKSSYLELAETLARNLSANSHLEELAAQDNLYTCLQTQAKWSLLQNKPAQAEAYLIELTQIDPYDATGYTELGLFYLKQDQHTLASPCFERACQLGPPGAGMNAYYHATCLEKLGDHAQAKRVMYQVTELDPTAVSPWLELIEYNKEEANFAEVKRIAQHIASTSDLIEQLDNDEITDLKSLISND